MHLCAMNDETYFSRKRFLKELSICGVFSPCFFIRHFFTFVPTKKQLLISVFKKLGMMGSTHTYDLPGAIPAAKRLDPGAVEMALNPEEVDMMDSDALQVRCY